MSNTIRGGAGGFKRRVSPVVRLDFDEVSLGVSRGLEASRRLLDLNQGALESSRAPRLNAP